MDRKPQQFKSSLIAFVGASVIGAFMVLGLIADGALRRVELVNQEAFVSPGRTASDVAFLR